MKRSQIARLLGACFVASMVVACGEDNVTEVDTETEVVGLSSEECTRLWDEARGDAETIPQDRAANYVTDFALVDADGDGEVVLTEWEAACAAGTVREPASN